MVAVVRNDFSKSVAVVDFFLTACLLFSLLHGGLVALSPVLSEENKPGRTYTSLALRF